jgi:hypothetical protein
MRADHHDFVFLLLTGNLADDVRGHDILRGCLRLHVEPYAHRKLALHSPGHAIVLLGRDDERRGSLRFAGFPGTGLLGEYPAFVRAIVLHEQRHGALFGEKCRAFRPD